jgi:hypothetical protein
MSPSKISLTFTLAGYESIGPWTADANIGSITSSNEIIAPAAEDAIISTKAVNCICAGPTQDQIIAFSLRF